MTLIEKINQIERIDNLIRRKSTGTPYNLSSKLGISERQVYNIINTMKEMGAPIFFCAFMQSYCYRDNVKFKFGFIPDDSNNMSNLKGGKTLDSSFSLLRILEKLETVYLNKEIRL